MKRTVVARLDLGQTRVAGYLLYLPNNENSFQETTPKETYRLIGENKVNGLIISEGEIVLDSKGFNQQNIKIRSGVGKYRNMVDTCKQYNTSYSVIKVTLKDFEEIYQLVTSQCGRFEYSSKQLKIIYNLADVAGIRLNNDGDIEVCDGVEILDLRSFRDIKDCDLDEIVQVEGTLMKVSEIDDLVFDELRYKSLLDLETNTDNILESARSIEINDKDLDDSKNVTKGTMNKKTKNKGVSKKKS